MVVTTSDLTVVLVVDDGTVAAETCTFVVVAVVTAVVAAVESGESVVAVVVPGVVDAGGLQQKATCVPGRSTQS